MDRPGPPSDAPERSPQETWRFRGDPDRGSGRYIVIRALEDGVVIMGLTRGRDTRSHHSERLDAGEVLVAQFTETTAAIKVRGRAEIHTDVGSVQSGA